MLSYTIIIYKERIYRRGNIIHTNLIDNAPVLWYNVPNIRGGVMILGKNIYLILTHTGTTWSRIIKKFNDYKYSHVMLSLDDNFDRMYSFGRKKWYNPFIAGFVVEDKDGDFFSFYNRAKCRVYKFAVTDKQYDDLCGVLQWFEENKHRVSYDIIGVILRYIGISFRQKDRYVCTHFVGSVLKDSGIAPMINKPEDLKPQDFETIANRISSKVIYEGFLRKIPRN